MVPRRPTEESDVSGRSKLWTFFSFIWIVSLLIRRRPAVPLSLADHLRTSNRFRLFVIFSWWKGEISCATPQSNWPTFWFADWPFWLTLKWFNSIKLKCWIKAAVNLIDSLFEFHLMRKCFDCLSINLMQLN